MRKINTRFFVFLVVALAVLAGAIFGLHQLQAGNIAEALLWQAHQAEKDGKLQRAAKYLGRYLEFARDDLNEREHLGMILSDPQVATTPQRRARARFVIEQVLAKDPQRHELRRRLCQTMIAGRMFDVAKEHLTYLEKNQPQSAEVPYLTGSWHEAQNQSVPAMAAYRRAITMDATQVDACVRLVGLLKQADFGKEPRHTEEIEQLIVAVLEKSPHDAGILSLAAQHAQEQGDTRIALKYLEDGLKLHPTEPRLYLALARVHGQNGKRGEAIDQLQVGLQKVRKEQQYDLRWSLANLLLDDSRLDAAPKVIQELRDVNPVSANYLEARLQMQRGRWFESVRLFEKIRPALKSVPELAFQADLYLGSCYEQLDEPMLQLTTFQRAAQSDPTSPAARRGMAGAYLALAQTTEALRIHHDLAAGTKDPDESARRRLEYVRLLLQSGPRQGARELRQIEQELNDIEKTLGKSLVVPLLRAELHFVRGEKSKAETLLQETIKEHPDRYEPWMALIALAAQQADPSLPLQLMQTAEKKFKDKAEFRLAQVRFWSQREGAEAALKRLEDDLAKFSPREQSTILQTVAEVHYDAGRYRDSARVIDRMMQIPGNAQDVRLRLQMLELALLQDDDAQARVVLNDIKRIEGDGSIDWTFGEAMRLIYQGHRGKKDVLEQARHLLTVAAAQRPNWHPIMQIRAELDELQGRPDQAIANYRQALDLGSRDPRVPKQLLILLSQAQRFDEVEQLLLRMQKQQGTTDEIVRYYVAHSCNRHDFKRAEVLIKRVVASNSTSYRDHLWMGQILSVNGQSPDDAEKALRRAIALAPQQPETWIGLVRHLISIGKNQQARSEIDNASKALPDQTKELTLAQCFELLGFLPDAAKNYKAAIDKNPTSAPMHRAAADFTMRLGRFDSAEMLYRTVYERKTSATAEDMTAARRGLALAIVKQNQPRRNAEALQLVGISLDDKGLVPDSKLAEALDERRIQAKVLGSLNHQRLRGKAIELLEVMQQKNALDAEDQYFLARLLVQHGTDPGLWSKSRTLLKSLTLQQPKNSRYLGYAAYQHIEQKEFTEAEQFITRLENVERQRNITPGSFGSIELRAKLFEMRGLGSQATTLLTEYADQPGASPVRKLLLAGLQGRLGNYKAAIDLCEEVRQTPEHTIEADANAVAILRMNKPSEAQPTKYENWRRERVRVETALRAAVAKDAKDFYTRLHLADLMELQGKYDEVEKLCREVLKVSDKNLVALNNLAWLLSQKADGGAEALTLVERAIEHYGPRPELVGTRAIVRLNMGEVEPALRDLERVVNEAPTPVRLFHLSRAYERYKNIASASALLRQANETGLTMLQLHPVEQAEYQRVTAELSKRQ